MVRPMREVIRRQDKVPGPTVPQMMRFPFEGLSAITVAHGFGKYPMVQVVERGSSLYGAGLYGTGFYAGSDQRTVLAPSSVVHNSPNQVTVTLATATNGEVLLFA